MTKKQRKRLKNARIKFKTTRAMGRVEALGEAALWQEALAGRMQVLGMRSLVTCIDRAAGRTQ